MRKASDKPAHASLLTFDDVNACVLKSYPDILAQWLPGGVQQGAEYSVHNPLRDDRSRGNFKINEKGPWADFAMPDAKGGDPISLYAWLHNLEQVEAKNTLANMFGLVQGRSGIDPAIKNFLYRIAARRQAPAQFGEPGQGWVQGPAPDDAPAPVVPVGCSAWRYQSLSGQLLGVVYRVDKPGERKQFYPMTWWALPDQTLSGQWQKKGFARPLPLYHQPELVLKPQAPVLLVEGEKAADAGQARFPDHAVLSWPGGSQQAAHVDLSPLYLRDVWLLPDHDEPGRLAMRKLADRLVTVVASLHVAVLPEGLPVGWDVADGTWASIEEAQAWLAGLSWTDIPTKPSGTPPVVNAEPARVTAAIARANGEGPRWEMAPATTWTPTPIPVPALARLEHEILRRVPMAHPVAAQQTALAIAARLAGRQVVTTTGDPASLYLALASPSVGDVRPYLSLAQSLMEQVGLAKSVRQQRLSSSTQMHKLLWRDPAMLYLCSEWGVVLAFAKRQPAGSQEQALTLLSELWDAKTLVIEEDDLKLPVKEGQPQDVQQVIRAPHVTMLAALSNDHLATAVKLSEMGRGALEQIQYWMLADEDFTETDPDALVTGAFPADLVDELQHVSRAVASAAAGNLVTVAQPWALPAQVEARFAAAIAPCYARLDAIKFHRSARPLRTASRLIVRRMACILAFWLNPAAPVITEALLDWCVDLEVARLTALLARFQSLSSEDGKLSAYQKVLDYISTAGSLGVRYSDLISGCWPYRNLADDKRDALIAQLLADESVVELTPDSKPGARKKSPVLIARAFVQEKTS